MFHCVKQTKKSQRKKTIYRSVAKVAGAGKVWGEWAVPLSFTEPLAYIGNKWVNQRDDGLGGRERSGPLGCAH